MDQTCEGATITSGRRGLAAIAEGARRRIADITAGFRGLHTRERSGGCRPLGHLFRVDIDAHGYSFPFLRGFWRAWGAYDVGLPSRPKIALRAQSGRLGVSILVFTDAISELAFEVSTSWHENVDDEGEAFPDDDGFK